MSKKHRCHICNHRPGRRITDPISKGGKTNPGDWKPSKRPCSCQCHQTRTMVATSLETATAP